MIYFVREDTTFIVFIKTLKHWLEQGTFAFLVMAVQRGESSDEVHHHTLNISFFPELYMYIFLIISCR